MFYLKQNIRKQLMKATSLRSTIEHTTALCYHIMLKKPCAPIFMV